MRFVWPRATAQRCWGSLTSRMLSWPLWWITASGDKGNEQLKFFMVADCFLRRQGNFPDYDTYYVLMDAYLAKDLVKIQKIADPFAEDFARKHLEDKLHYFVGAGCLYGATYSYAMCYWEEMHWIRTKSIDSAEFFHGMLEIVDKDTPVTGLCGRAARPAAPGPARGEVPAADLRELHHYTTPMIIRWRVSMRSTADGCAMPLCTR